LEAALSELSQADLIHQTALYPSAEYAFKHALKHEVALDMQLHERRRRTHAAVARAIAEESPDRLDESAALIAHHWEAAGETLEAARWHRRSAEWISSDDPLKAVQHWQKVRELADTLDASDETDRLHLDACSFIVRWCWRTGYENFDALFAEGETLARRLHDDSAVVSLQLGRGPYHASRGEFAAAVEATRRAVELAERAGDELHLRNARWQHCYYLWTTGAVHDAHDGLEAIVEREEVGLDILFSGNSEWLMSAMLLSQIKMWLGDMESAVALNARTIQIARRSDRKEELGWVLGACAALAVLRGEHRNSEAPDLDRAMVEALEIAETLGSSFSRAISMYDLTLSHIVAERWTEAIDSGRRALRMAREERAGTESIVTTLCWLVTATLRTGDADGARELAEEALRTSERFGARLGQAQAHLQLASVELERLGPRARAEIGRHLERSREIAGSLGARALLPQIRETEARLEARDGNGEQAGTMLRDALALYEEVGATGHAARLRRELGSRTDFSR
jgi:adenylate cyclase